MEFLVKKYADKLIRAGLAGKSGWHRPLVGGLDDTLTWNRSSGSIRMLEHVFAGLNINSLVFLRPVEPYASLLQYLGQQALSSNGLIEPKDCETRTFLHELAVLSTFNPDKITKILKKQRTVIICPEKGSADFGSPAVIAHGSISPEQGFVTISSVCFAGFVKFFTDYLKDLQKGTAKKDAHELFDRISENIPALPSDMPGLIPGPFKTEHQVYKAVIEAGLKTVEYDLVDSYFGNVSYCRDNILYISQTGSSLDELAGCIDPVPLDNSTSAGLTASSELSAHLKTMELTGNRALLHGHPKFCVILSMDCDPAQKAACEFQDQCHIKCPEKRQINTTPIVPGEVGTGPYGLCNTLPFALLESNSVIVYGHGLFATGKDDFKEAFKTMLAVETQCRQLYFEKVSRLRSK